MLQPLLDQYSDIFKYELGTINTFKAKLELCFDEKSLFFGPCHVPFALKMAINEKLDRLVNAGILEKVTSNDLAAPIVPVPRKRWQNPNMCDYKVTVNQYNTLFLLLSCLLLSLVVNNFQNWICREHISRCY